MRSSQDVAYPTRQNVEVKLDGLGQANSHLGTEASQLSDLGSQLSALSSQLPSPPLHPSPALIESFHRVRPGRRSSPADVPHVEFLGHLGDPAMCGSYISDLLGSQLTNSNCARVPGEMSSSGQKPESAAVCKARRQDMRTWEGGQHNPIWSLPKFARTNASRHHTAHHSPRLREAVSQRRIHGRRGRGPLGGRSCLRARRWTTRCALLGYGRLGEHFRLHRSLLYGPMGSGERPFSRLGEAGSSNRCRIQGERAQGGAGALSKSSNAGAVLAMCACMRLYLSVGSARARPRRQPRSGPGANGRSGAW